MAKLLVIEDDADLREAVVDYLTFQHHQVEYAKTVSEALDKLSISVFEVLILDWQLPDGNGIDILRTFREQGGQTPVLMLTGKDKIADKQMGFEVGCDDYLTKPFDMAELGLRVAALLRRPQVLPSQNLQVRDIVLDVSSYRVTKSGKDIALLPREFAVLQFLMRNANKVFSAKALIERVWESDSEVSDQAVTACIRRLRQKVESEGEPPLIRTLHGAGYRLEP